MATATVTWLSLPRRVGFGSGVRLELDVDAGRCHMKNAANPMAGVAAFFGNEMRLAAA